MFQTIWKGAPGTKGLLTPNKAIPLSTLVSPRIQYSLFIASLSSFSEVPKPVAPFLTI